MKKINQFLLSVSILCALSTSVMAMDDRQSCHEVTNPGQKNSLHFTIAPIEVIREKLNTCKIEEFFEKDQ